jgi:outer membrane protein assembly factor BamB
LGSDATTRARLNATAVWTSFVLALFLLLFLIGGLLCEMAFAAQNTPAAPIVWDLPTVGPPTTNVLLQGAGFDPLTAIDIYFDSTVLATTTSDKNGCFGNGVVTATGASWTRLQVPATALPGQHTITAQEHVGQKSAQRTFLVRTDWPQYRFAPDHAGLNPYENVLNTSNVAGLTMKWNDIQGYSSPTVVGGVVYVGSHDDNLYALDAATGTVLWTYTTGNYIDSTPAVVNGAVYFGGWDDYFYALNASDGTLLWKFFADGFVSSSPSVANGVVYFGNDMGVVYALDAASGTKLWSYDTGQHAATSSPTLAAGMEFIQAYYHLYAFDAVTGQMVWTYTTGGVGSSTPAYANGILYAGGGDMFCLYAFKATTGQLLWKYQTSPSLVDSSPAVANGLVYFGSQNGLYALNANTGVLVWKYASGGFADSSPVVANGVLYATTPANGGIFAFDAAKGNLLWTTGGGAAAPAVADAVVYVAGSGHTVAYSLPQALIKKHH